MKVRSRATRLAGLATAAAMLVAMAAAVPAQAEAPEATVHDVTTRANPFAVDPRRYVGTTEATFLGEVNPQGLETVYWFEYSTDGFATKTMVPGEPVPAGSGEEAMLVRQDVSGLQPDTAYEFQLVARNEDGTTESREGENTDESPNAVPFMTFGVFDFDAFARARAEAGGEEVPAGPAKKAGTHPLDLVTDVVLNEYDFDPVVSSDWRPFGSPRDIVVDLPPGMIGNPTVVAECRTFELAGAGAAGGCPAASQVGRIHLGLDADSRLVAAVRKPRYSAEGHSSADDLDLFNMTPPDGTAARFGFNFKGVLVFLDSRVRSGTDYGFSTDSRRISQTTTLAWAYTEIWGVPQSHRYDEVRGAADREETEVESGLPQKPFLTMPTRCGPEQRFGLQARSWEEPGIWVEDETLHYEDPEAEEAAVPLIACDALEFSPRRFAARPTNSSPDAPTGFDVDLEFDQSGLEDVSGTSEAHLRDAKVVLPEELTINPSSANGLDACSAAEIGLLSEPGVSPGTYTPAPANCPDASKIGRATVQTPLLDHLVNGFVYLAQPFENENGNLITLYIALNDPESGTVVKLPVEVTPDPSTGQLTTELRQNPQIPFSKFELDFFSGATAALKTPDVCGTYSTNASLTPWSAPESGPPASESDSYLISGGSCPTSAGARSHSPSFNAGAVSPQAGQYSPFVINLRRGSSSQQLSEVTVEPPPGLVAKLAGVPECSDAALAAAAGKDGRDERANPSCPANSKVGDVYVAAGAGPAPFWTKGNVYLAGPYKGAPLSMAIVTAAVAGPFDLGTVVVRTALHVDPVTAEITADADPIPSILKGIPLDVRVASIRLNRSEFSKNPTSCDVMSVDGGILSTQGALANVSSRFQLGECARLGFEPNLFLRLFGGVRRGAHPALRAVLLPRPGDSNISRGAVTLPRSAFLDQGNIGTVCTRVQFAADKCPARSVYGQAVAHTPVLDEPVRGPVYLRSSDDKLPNLVADLKGRIDVELVGRLDSVRGGIRTVFETVPDAPVERFILLMKGGKQQGLVVNSRNICVGRNNATARFISHHGRFAQSNPAVNNTRCAKLRRRARRKAKRTALKRQRLAALSAVRRSP